MSIAATEAVYRSPAATVVASAGHVLAVEWQNGGEVVVLPLMHQSQTGQRCCMHCQLA